MSLPQGYKRWPKLRKGELCGHHVGTGEIPAVVRPCSALAVVIVAPSYGGELLGFLPLCLLCYEKVAKNVTTKQEWQSFKRACRKVGVSPDSTAREIAQHYSEPVEELEPIGTYPVVGDMVVVSGRAPTLVTHFDSDEKACTEDGCALFGHAIKRGDGVRILKRKAVFCDRCGAREVLYRHAYLDVTLDLCTRCKADAEQDDADAYKPQGPENFYC